MLGVVWVRHDRIVTLNTPSDSFERSILVKLSYCAADLKPSASKADASEDATDPHVIIEMTEKGECINGGIERCRSSPCIPA